jgi:hypothetical protein
VSGGLSMFRIVSRESNAVRSRKSYQSRFLNLECLAIINRIVM